MKQYRITVNGKTYDVAVEELGGVRSAAQATATAAAPLAAPAAPAPAPSAAPSSSGSQAVKSPMPGTITALKAVAGQAVKRGEVLLILEAMKMENEIVAPADGTVAAFRVQAGASVNTGDTLVELS
jgi:biotin carboxyl carrier protein